MSKQNFTLWENVVFDNTTVSGNGVYDLGVSESVSNSVALNSLKLVVDYSNFVPTVEQINAPINYHLDVLVEGKIGSAWYPVAYQFTAARDTQRGPKRIIQLQPSISGFDAGVDDIMYVGNATVARVSRQQGSLPDTEFRIRLILWENGYGTSAAFQQVTISAFGEAFDV